MDWPSRENWPGYEATRQLRLAGWEGPIVALTAHDVASDRTHCLSAGCDDYVTKPIDRKRLAAVVGTYIRNRASTRTEADPV